MRTGARARHAEQFHGRNDVLVPMRRVAKGLAQIEDHIRLDVAHRIEQRPDVIVQTQAMHLVAAFEQRLPHIVLGIAAVRIGELGGEVVVGFYRVRQVEHHKYASGHGYSSPRKRVV